MYPPWILVAGVGSQLSSHSMLKSLNQRLHKCRLCLEAGYEITPGAIFRHPPKAEVMLIGQAPGVTEVQAKRPFNAGSGRRLFQWLAQAGWVEDEFRRNYVMTAVTKCYPGKGKNGKGDRVPSKKEQGFCRPFLEEELQLYQPRLIIPVGGLAIKLFYPPARKLTEVIGTAIYRPGLPPIDYLNDDRSDVGYCQSFNASFGRKGCWIIPLPHPSGASLWPNKPKNKALIDRALDMLKAVRIAWEI